MRQESAGSLPLMPLEPKNVRDWGANMEGINRNNKCLFFLWNQSYTDMKCNDIVILHLSDTITLYATTNDATTRDTRMRDIPRSVVQR